MNMTSQIHSYSHRVVQTHTHTHTRTHTHTHTHSKHTSESRIGKSWITLRTTANNIPKLRNGHHPELIVGAWKQPGHIDISTVISSPSSDWCPTTNWGGCDLVARDLRDTQEQRGLPADSCICGANVHTLN